MVEWRREWEGRLGSKRGGPCGAQMKRQRQKTSKEPGKSNQEQRELAEQTLKSLEEITIDIASDASRAEATLKYSFDLRSPNLDLLGELMEQTFPQPKRRPGRPTLPNQTEILDAAAKAKAETGKYTQVAARFRVTPKQLTDLVRNNRPYFNHKVKEFTAVDVKS